MICGKLLLRTSARVSDRHKLGGMRKFLSSQKMLMDVGAC